LTLTGSIAFTPLGIAFSFRLREPVETGPLERPVVDRLNQVAHEVADPPGRVSRGPDRRDNAVWLAVGRPEQNLEPTGHDLPGRRGEQLSGQGRHEGPVGSRGFPALIRFRNLTIVIVAPVRG
jgi:hypothetical protein